MATIPAPVAPNIFIEPVGLRKFPVPYHRALCRNCSWVSYDYPTQEEAGDRGESHAERCCQRINMELALQVEVIPVEAQNLERGAQVLLRDLRVMDIENIETMVNPDTMDTQVWVTYSINSLESEILVLPLGHIVKVVEP